MGSEVPIPYIVTPVRMCRGRLTTGAVKIPPVEMVLGMLTCLNNLGKMKAGGLFIIHDLSLPEFCCS